MLNKDKKSPERENNSVPSKPTKGKERKEDKNVQFRRKTKRVKILVKVGGIRIYTSYLGKKLGKEEKERKKEREKSVDRITVCVTGY